MYTRHVLKTKRKGIKREFKLKEPSKKMYNNLRPIFKPQRG